VQTALTHTYSIAHVDHTALEKWSLVFDRLDVSEATRGDYKQRIGHFLNYLREFGLNIDSFLFYKQSLESRNDLSVSTKNKYLVTARIFLKELHRLGTLPADITVNTKSFKQNRKHKKTGLNEGEVDLLMKKLQSLDDSSFNLRTKALVSLLTFQGLRQIEIVRLDVSDLNLAQGTAFIRGKGMDDKELIYLHPETVKVLKRYLKGCRIADGALFRSFGPRKSERLGTLTIKREMQSLFQELGIENTTHGFRHYYITSLLKKLDVRDARKFSRHSNLEMLIIYDDEIDMSTKASTAFSCFNALTIGA
jgi:integrase